jgi:catechol 2,3-dioxygenase-like lactoylglutathione lyase family enzyme
VGLRVPDAALAREGLPFADDCLVELGEGLCVRLAEGDGDLDHVAFQVPHPEQTAAEFERYGFARAEATAVSVGGARLVFEQGDPDDGGRPLLNHLGLLVESAEQHRIEAEARGLEVEWVDAANTLAVFLNGPDGIRIEYVEHKSSFSLA